jgi:hypothetical protein
VSFAAITLCVTSQRGFIVVIAVYFVMTQPGNFWIHPRILFELIIRNEILERIGTFTTYAQQQ